jgi:sulfide:quinone oxidoreductase
VLAEFGYGGKLLPSFPEMADRWHEAKPAVLAAQGAILPPIYWKAMLKGKEWMAKPEVVG